MKISELKHRSEPIAATAGFIEALVHSRSHIAEPDDPVRQAV